MVTKFLNISPKVGALTWDELVEITNNDDDLLEEDINVSNTCYLDDAYTVLIYLLAGKFTKDVMKKFDSFLKRKGKEFSFGLYYDRGLKEAGFQLIIDSDNYKLDFQSFLTKYFEWETIKYEPDLIFDDFVGTIF